MSISVQNEVCAESDTKSLCGYWKSDFKGGGPISMICDIVFGAKFGASRDPVCNLNMCDVEI